MKKLFQSKHIDFYRHLSFAAIGGFLGAYAILCRAGMLANAQTMNLLELVIDALAGSWYRVLLHLGSFAVYVTGTMLTVLLPRLYHADMRRLSPCITAAMVILLGFLPADMELIVSLYPIFFAMSIQWSSFTGAGGNYSSTIFSTNNTKQASLSLAEFFCDKDRAHLRRVWFYSATLLCFHAGAAVSYFAVRLCGLRAAWCALPLIAWAYYLVTREERAERAAATVAG